MFLVEGLAAAVVGVWTFWYLPSRPAEAAWLTVPERQVLQTKLAEEADARRAHSPVIFGRLAPSPCAAAAGLYLLIQMSVYGVTFYLPAQVEKLLVVRRAGR